MMKATNNTLCKHECGDFQEKNEENNEANGFTGSIAQ